MYFCFSFMKLLYLFIYTYVCVCENDYIWNKCFLWWFFLWIQMRMNIEESLMESVYPTTPVTANPSPPPPPVTATSPPSQWVILNLHTFMYMNTQKQKHIYKPSINTRLLCFMFEILYYIYPVLSSM